jgi:hypothetical protein
MKNIADAGEAESSIVAGSCAFCRKRRAALLARYPGKTAA